MSSFPGPDGGAPRRILLISSNSSGSGGGERYLTYLTEGLRALGHQVDALLSNASYMDAWCAQLNTAGAVVYRRPLAGLSDRRLRFVQALADRCQVQSIADVCRALKPDGIIVNQQYDEDALDYISAAQSASDGPMLSVMHLPPSPGMAPRLLASPRRVVVNRWYRSHSPRLVFVSRDARRAFEHYYSSPRPTAVVPNAVSWPDALLLPDARSLHDPPVIGYVGKFVPQKNLLLLVRAWKRLRRSGTPANLLLVGDGPQRVDLETELRSEPESSWQITGWTERPEQFYGDIDLFAMSSRFEGMSLSLIEGAGRGLPSVVTNCFGVSEVAERAPWVSVVSDPSPLSFSVALGCALENWDTLRTQARGQADAFRQYFSPERMAADLLAVLEVSPHY